MVKLNYKRWRGVTVMEILATITLLSTLALIAIVVKVMQQQKFQQQMMSQLVEQIDALRKNVQLEVRQANETSMVTISKQFEQHIDEIKERISTQLKDDLHTYIHFDEQQQQAWFTQIEAESDKRKKIQLLESALNKFPSNKQFFVMYSKLLEETIELATPSAKKKIIEKMHYAARIFFDNCNSSDASFAMMKKDEAIRLGHTYMKQVTEVEKQKLIERVATLRQLVNSNAALIKIEQADEQINQVTLARYPEIQSDYKKITATLSSRLMKKVTDEQMKQYNLKAVTAFKNAHSKFTANETTMKTGTNLHEVIALLGGWKTEYLQAPTQMYYQSVYADIFGKLKAEVKPKMTEDMLKAPVKEVA